MVLGPYQEGLSQVVTIAEIRKFSCASVPDGDGDAENELLVVIMKDEWIWTTMILNEKREREREGDTTFVGG